MSPTAKVILGLLALGAETGYDVKRIVEGSTRFFWNASYGQIYPELARLEADGLVRSKAHGRRRVYSLTAKGRRALRDWLADPAPDDVFEVRDEGLLKLFFGDLVDKRTQRANVERRRRWYEGAAELFRAIEEAADGPRDAATRDALAYGIALMEWNADWYRRYEHELRRRRRSRPSPRPGTAARRP